VFTARYALSPYIKQICFVFKGLIWSVGMPTRLTAFQNRLRVKTNRTNIPYSCIPKHAHLLLTDTARSKISYQHSCKYYINSFLPVSSTPTTGTSPPFCLCHCCQLQLQYPRYITNHASCRKDTSSTDVAVVHTGYALKFCVILFYLHNSRL
jgi:hypothetical protein